MKNLIKWTKELTIGIKEIDEQHKKFIGLINKAYEVHDSKSKKAMEKELNDLMEYARIHFSTEEVYFEKWEYPFAEEHMAEHAELLKEVLKYKDKFDEDKCDCEEFLKFLVYWLETHLKKHDFKYRDYFKEKGFI